ncbi:hypothetical protein ABT065_02820 [Streptomyces sp. NPDC002764]|uniref:MmyB family transcriptional regulator n=1 Tax=Streptomyces sp. NPDC002764 TaxID=3154428 RepID=UPI0033252EFA
MDVKNAGTAHTGYLFIDDRARDCHADWEQDARHVVSARRLIAGRDPSDPALMALIGELATHSPEFRTWWAGRTVTVHAAGTRAIRHPVVGELTVAYETLTLGSAPEVRIVTYLADPGTPSADALDLLRSWTATTHSSTEDGSLSSIPPAPGQSGRRHIPKR